MFTKGHEKAGGRGKGSSNKIPKPVKELLSNFCENKFNRFIQEVDGLTGVDYCKMYISIVEYILPKPQRVTFVDENKTPTEIKFSFLESINVTDEVSTFSELPVKKQAELLKKAKVKVKPRAEKSYDKPVSSSAEHRPDTTYRPKQETVYTPPPTPEKKHEQMETIDPSKFNIKDYRF